MVELQKPTLGEVMGLSKDKAVEIMRQAGIVGAGDGGFPTYFKYRNLQPMLLVNATESEPGYWADKMVHREYLQVLLELYESATARRGRARRRYREGVSRPPRWALYLVFERQLTVGFPVWHLGR